MDLTKPPVAVAMEPIFVALTPPPAKKPLTITTVLPSAETVADHADDAVDLVTAFHHTDPHAGIEVLALGEAAVGLAEGVGHVAAMGAEVAAEGLGVVLEGLGEFLCGLFG